MKLLSGMFSSSQQARNLNMNYVARLCRTVTQAGSDSARFGLIRPWILLAMLPGILLSRGNCTCQHCSPTEPETAMKDGGQGCCFVIVQQRQNLRVGRGKIYLSQVPCNHGCCQNVCACPILTRYADVPFSSFRSLWSGETSTIRGDIRNTPSSS